jgi:Clp protease
MALRRRSHSATAPARSSAGAWRAANAPACASPTCPSSSWARRRRPQPCPLSGTKGKRYALPHARVLLHQPYGGAEGQAVDIEIQAKEIVRNRELMNQIIARHTGQPLERVSKDTDRDFILTAEQAVEYGAVDEIITSRKIRPEHAVAAAGGS